MSKIDTAVQVFKECARPFVTYVSGFSVAYAAMAAPTNFQVVGLAAALAGGVAWLRSKDLRTSVPGPNAGGPESKPPQV